jgi:putative ABC transport system permease protein
MWFNRRRDPRIRDEIQFHRDRLIEDYIAAGISRADAERRAFLEFGNVAATEERVKDVRGRWLEDFGRDIRYALRALGHSRSFSAVAVLTLALGIGANAAIFTVINAVIFKPIHASDSGRLLGLFQEESGNTRNFRMHSYPDFLDIRANQGLFEDVLAFGSTSVALEERDLTREVVAHIVSANFFSLLGVSPLYGRGFLPEEETSPTPVAVLNYPFWKRLGGDPAIVGTRLKLTRGDVTVVGVMPEGFTGTMLDAPALYLAFGSAETFFAGQSQRAPSIRTSRDFRRFVLVARLKAGLDRAALPAGLALASERFQAAAPVDNKGWRLTGHPPSRLSFGARPENLASEIGPLAVLALGLSSIVLAVSCLNLANMMFARGANRHKEIAVRLAIGASRWRILRQLLTEGFLLAVLGAGGGLVLSLWGIGVLQASMMAGIDRAIPFDFTPDLRLFAALAACCCAATVLFSLGPSRKLVRADVVAGLKENAAEPVGKRHGIFAVRNLLVVGQIAFSLVLLAVASLFLHSAAKSAAMDPGFDMGPNFYARIRTDLAGYDDAQSRELLRAAVERVAGLPGVEASSLGLFKPVSGARWVRGVQLAGAPKPTPMATSLVDGREVQVHYNVIGADYFRTLGLSLVRGREFDRSEVTSPNASSVAIVSMNLAERLWPGEDPVGRRIQWPADDTNPPTVLVIVGVAAPVTWDLFEGERPAMVYVPLGQDFQRSVYLHVRLAPGVAPAPLMTLVREELRRLDSRLPITELNTLRASHEQGMQVRLTRMGATLFGAFGLAALLLSVIGVYGLRAYSVASRTREIGLRMALGANARGVLWLMLSEGVNLSLVGLGIGLLAAAVVGLLARGFLFDVSALDPVAFILAPLVLALAVLAACFFPAYRATRINPMGALRDS